MALIVPEQSQRPYRFGMTLLCIGALFNWLGLADSYTEPVPAVRYIGVVLIAVGAALICLAMCCWMRAVQDPQYAREIHNRENVAVQVINIEEPDPRSLEKPPDYSSVVDFPPSYEDAIKELDANKLLYNALNNNNDDYQAPIKTVEDTVLFISDVDEHRQTDSTDSSNNEEKQADINEEKTDAVKANETEGEIKKDFGSTNVILEKVEAKDISPSDTQIVHSIVEIPETVYDKLSQNNCRSKNSNSGSDKNSDIENDGGSSEAAGAIKVNLVGTQPSNSSRSKSIASVFRKSFRSLRNAAGATDSQRSEAMSKSGNCDIENVSSL